MHRTRVFPLLRAIAVLPVLFLPTSRVMAQEIDCLPYERAAGGRCMPCENGYQDPADASRCVPCTGGAALKWMMRGSGYQGEVIDHYRPGLTPLCQCPPHASPREDGMGRFAGCDLFCRNKDEVWSESYGRCVRKKDLAPASPGGQACRDDDGDGLDNCFEATFGSSPTNPDTDGDGLDDYREWKYSCKPGSPDTDGDTVPDRDEVLAGAACNSADTDRDGLTDREERLHNTSLHKQDTDGDGLSDYQEVKVHSTSPINEDTDDDGLTDGEEIKGPAPAAQAAAIANPGKPSLAGAMIARPLVLQQAAVLENFHSNPLRKDTDGDGLLDYFEVKSHKTDPKKRDTDGDRIPDDVEVHYGLNALDAADNDRDGDDLSDYDELFHADRAKRTNPYLPDTDFDGIPDRLELVGWDATPSTVVLGTIRTDPNRADSDGDGLGDLAEVRVHGSDPNRPDSDSDTLPDGREVRTYRTSPTAFDSDGDGLHDGMEVQKGSDPMSADTDGDTVTDGQDPDPLHTPNETDQDNDGLSDQKEARYGSDPRNPDSDGDDLSDGEEVYRYRTNPVSADTDRDKLEDKFEISLGLDPTQTDTDGDGFTDLHEYTNDGVQRALTPEKTFPKVPRHLDEWAASAAKSGQTVRDRTIHGQLFPNGLASVRIENVRQTILGNCFILAALKSIANLNPQYIMDMMTDNHDGTYTVKFYKDTDLTPTAITVDAAFPAFCDSKGCNPNVLGWIKDEAVTRNINGVDQQVYVKVLWPVVFTKAFAVLDGWSYKRINGGMFWDSLDPLLGQKCWWTFSLDDAGRRRAFWKQMESSMRYTWPMVFANTGKDLAGYARCDTYKKVDGMHVWAFLGETSKAADGETLYHIQNPHNDIDYEKLSLDEVVGCFYSSAVGKRTLGATYQDRN